MLGSRITVFNCIKNPREGTHAQARLDEHNFSLTPPNDFISSSIKLPSFSASIVKDEAKVTRQRARLERRRMRIMRQKIPSPPPPPPPHRPLPLYLLRHIRSLTSDEVLVYAKKEMENISSVLNDPDPDLYAPLFRNVSIFDNTSKQSSRVKRYCFETR
ncbi:hypothetical protein LOK49_LG05G01739 [Camellia lanceoleosa]|uniref:Uncharacterized protein n=1 Tax=Camellia lanceoleosa TaxID=1840588 RepID=A0ACC0HT99_9ERIC|nr:hypothetical protein LOK49_LG05G01739 [Camellia lanceoleosa]